MHRKSLLPRRVTAAIAPMTAVLRQVGVSQIRPGDVTSRRHDIQGMEKRLLHFLIAAILAGAVAYAWPQLLRGPDEPLQVSTHG
jgi:hypothetical protein